MKKYMVLTAMMLMGALMLNALEIIDAKGISHLYQNAALHQLNTQELKTTREKDGVVRHNTWQGIRFDQWLAEQNLGSFGTIRFESDDRYLVSLSKAEFDSLESWLVVAQDSVRFDGYGLRLIFPALREMQWIRNLQRVVLEDFFPLPCPGKFFLMQPALASLKLHHEPKPFVKIDGWYIKDLLNKAGGDENCQVILMSRDGLKLSLNYPLHLEGAVLEKADDHKLNLKSPQIPGGMWMKDIVYLQAGNVAFIEQDYIGGLITVAKALNWEQRPDLQFHLFYPQGEEVMNFGDALAEPQAFSGVKYFELN